jgi:hypothetical protein
MLSAVNAVLAYREFKVQTDARRIPEEFRGPTYFGTFDEWIYNTEETETVCEVCESYNLETFYGHEIRSTFPYWQIIDFNVIYPSVHPNCRCRLVRKTFVSGTGEEENIGEVP